MLVGAAVFIDLHLLGVPHEQRRHGRHEGEGEDEGADQRQHDRRAHRDEGLALHSLEHEQRREDQQDDQLAERCRLDHLSRCGAGDLEPFVPGQHPPRFRAALTEHQQGVLDHDHGAVDHKAEVQRAEAHQVPADSETVHADDGEQEADRDHQGGDAGRPNVAQQQEQHDDDQQRAFSKIACDGRDGGVHQGAAVEHRDRLDPRREGLANLLQSVAGRLGHRAAVSARDHQGRTENGFVAVTAAASQARRLADLDGRYVGHTHDKAVSIDDGRLGQILDGRRQGVGAY
ncbi:hypothetical protein D3C77_297260 [compost metagenome]